MNDYTIAETYTLPSKGKVYDTYVDPVIKLRSMTTEDEMKRLAHSDRPYQLMSDIIEGCIVGEKPAVSVYDMCIGDYQYLLHKLRVVTYGSAYKMDTVCKWCGSLNKSDINLDELKTIEYDESIKDKLTITLPHTKKVVTLKLQTPRSLDDIQARKREILKKSPNFEGEPAVMLTIASLIDTIDGQMYDPIRLENVVRKLPMKDSNYILRWADKLNSAIGIDPTTEVVCKECGVDYTASFRITAEFYGPTIDE